MMENGRMARDMAGASSSRPTEMSFLEDGMMVHGTAKAFNITAMVTYILENGRMTSVTAMAR